MRLHDVVGWQSAYNPHAFPTRWHVQSFNNRSVLKKEGSGRKKKKKRKTRNKYRKSTSEKFVLGRVDPHHMAIRCSCVRTPVSGCKSAGSSVGNSGGSVASVSVSVSVNGHTGRGGHAP